MKRHERVTSHTFYSTCCDLGQGEQREGEQMICNSGKLGLKKSQGGGRGETKTYTIYKFQQTPKDPKLNFEGENCILKQTILLNYNFMLKNVCLFLTSLNSGDS